MGLGCLAKSLSISEFRKFTKRPELYKLAFLFCDDEKAMQVRLGAKRSKNQFEHQKKYLKITVFSAILLSSSFSTILLKIAKENIKNSLVNNLPPIEYYLTTTFKICIYIFMFIFFATSTLRSLVNFFELIEACHYLTNRLDKESEKISHYLRKRKSKRFAGKFLIDLINSYNLILKDHEDYGKFFNKTLYFALVNLIVLIACPRLILSETNRRQKMAYYLNYFICIAYFSVLFYHNSIFVYNVSMLNLIRTIYDS